MPKYISEEEELPMFRIVVVPDAPRPEAMLRVVLWKYPDPLTRLTRLTFGLEAMVSRPTPPEAAEPAPAADAPERMYTVAEAELPILIAEEEELPRFTVVVEPEPVPADAMLRVRGLEASPLARVTEVTRGLLPSESAELKAVPVPERIRTLAVDSVFALAMYTEVLAESAMRTMEEEEFPMFMVVVEPAPVLPDAMFTVKGLEASPLAKDAVTTRGFAAAK